jgi:hypothetical protein
MILKVTCLFHPKPIDLESLRLTPPKSPVLSPLLSTMV